MIPERLSVSTSLINELTKQSIGLPVEILCLLDNKQTTIGEKRNRLIEMASGEYITFIDDDDEVVSSYIEQILENTKTSPDCITYNIEIKKRNSSLLCRYAIGNDNSYSDVIGSTTKQLFNGIPTHIHVWKKELVKNIKFQDKNTNEDVEWCEKTIPLIKSIINIDYVLYHYRIRYI